MFLRRACNGEERGWHRLKIERGSAHSQQTHVFLLLRFLGTLCFMTLEQFHPRHASMQLRMDDHAARLRHQVFDNTSHAHERTNQTARIHDHRISSNRKASTPTRQRTYRNPEPSPPMRYSSTGLTRTDRPLSPYQSTRNKLPTVASSDEALDDAWDDSPNPKNLFDERDLSCTSFARDASKWADSRHLSPIQFRSRGAVPEKESSRASAAISRNDPLDRDQPSESANKAVRNEEDTLFSFFDDNSDIGVSTDLHEHNRTSTAAHRSKHVMKKKSFLRKYSKSLSCIIPRCSSGTPDTSASSAPSEYQIHMGGDDDEIEITFSSDCRDESSSILSDYSLLLQDPAYRHAQQAGFLWQSLVGQHLRFPHHWWNGRRGPPLGNSKEESPWYHIGSCSTQNHRSLKVIVRNRASPGRLLLHVLVRKEGDIVCDLAVGCYHPNARGIRQHAKADPLQENIRHVWLAVRKRRPCSVIDPWIKSECRSPIGKSPITNENMLAVYGDKAPFETLFLRERDLFDLISSTPKSCHPAVVLCESFVFN